MFDRKEIINQSMCEKPELRLKTQTKKTKEKYEEEWAEMENGSYYYGTVKNGMPNGFGKEYRNNSIRYTGFFLDGKWHGKGMLEISTNNEGINGEFIDGYFCGI